MLRKYINFGKIYYTIFFWLKCAKFFIEGHSFLTLANFISLFLGLTACLYCLIFFEPEDKITGGLFLIPVILVYFVSLLSFFIYKKFKLFSRIFAFLLNNFIIIVFQILIASFVFASAYEFDLETKSNQVKYYPLALERISEQDKILHFPAKIPDNAKNVFLDVDTISFFGSESIYLAFDTDKEYIDNELKKHKYIKISNYSRIQPFDYSFYCNNLDLNGFTFYIINDRKHANPKEHSFPFHYGIGVNYPKNKILYYYENPD